MLGLTTVELIMLLNVSVTTLTLVALATNVRFAYKTFKLFTLNLRYTRHFELSKFLIDHPQIISASVRRETEVAFATNRLRNEALKKEKVYLDMIIDLAEFFYLSAQFEDRDFNEELVRRMMSNERMQKHWHSPLRGTVRDDFSRFVTQYYNRRS